MIACRFCEPTHNRDVRERGKCGCPCHHRMQGGARRTVPPRPTETGIAAARVAAFLDARAEMRGPIDTETITEIWVAGERHTLDVADLRALVALAERKGP